VWFTQEANTKEELRQNVIKSMEHVDWLHQWDIVPAGTYEIFEYDNMTDYLAGRRRLHLLSKS
jgi:hypothetical protein